jgi:DNA-binding NarL/FixJ family response regulator
MTQEGHRIRVLIADDHPVFRDGLRAMIATEPDLELVGEAAGGEEAVAMARGLQPDVILMDLHMPGLNGTEATRQIRDTVPGAKVLVLTMSEDDASVVAAIRAGARGFVVKGIRAIEATRAIRSVAAGEAIFSPSVATRLLELVADARLAAPTKVFPELTDRERETLNLIARGCKNAEIAGLLHVSPKTVRNYVTSIFDKLDLVDRSEAIIRARNSGLG